MKPVYFFEGVDPAPSDSQRSDHGTLVVGAATPRFEITKDTEWSEAATDWWFDFVYARVITHTQKLTARQWSGLIYQHHRRFSFERILMDPGSGGGGVLVARELRSVRQVIDGVECEVVPICDQVDGPKLVAHGEFILNLFKRGDPGIESVWPNVADASKSLAGDELLKDALLSTFKEALDTTQVGFPADEATLPEWFRPDAGGTPALPVGRTDGWPEERVWALKNLAAATAQLRGILVATHEDGTHVFSKRGAHVFSSIGRDDLAMGCMLCYAAFRIWLRGEAWRSGQSAEDEVGFSGR